MSYPSPNRCLLVLSGCWLIWLMTAMFVLPIHATPPQIMQAEPVAVDARGDVDTLRLPILPVDDWLPQQSSVVSAKATPVTDSFTDSQGRTILYRYALPDGANASTPQPVMIFFHGNNSGTQQRMLDVFFSGVQRDAHLRGLVAVMVASPTTRRDGTTRHWYKEDEQAVQEFITQRLPQHFSVDTDRLYFVGASQGTCFLNDFMRSYGENYGGGFHGGCGCYNGLTARWTPSQTFRNKMKVYVSTTKDDFLYNPSWEGYGYYKYTLGFDTRGNLESAGAHCSKFWSHIDIALDWFTGQTNLPEEPFRPHWTRISPDSDVRGLALKPDGTLVKSTHDDGSNTATIHTSKDRGASWQPKAQHSGAHRDVITDASHVYAIKNNQLHASANDGTTFAASTAPQNSSVYAARSGSDGTPYINTFAGQVFQAEDGGNRFTLLDNGALYFMNGDNIGGLASGDVLFTDSRSTSTQTKLLIGGKNRGGVANIPLPASNFASTMHSATWDGRTVYAFSSLSDGRNWVLNGQRSGNLGGQWQALTIPAETKSAFWQPPTASALAENTLILHGSWSSSWLSTDQGDTWQRLPGIASTSTGSVVSSGTHTYYRGGYHGGLFRLILKESDLTNDPVTSEPSNACATNSQALFCDGFESM